MILVILPNRFLIRLAIKLWFMSIFRQLSSASNSLKSLKLIKKWVMSRKLLEELKTNSLPWMMLNLMKRDPTLLENSFNRTEFSNALFGLWLMMLLKKNFKLFWKSFLGRIFSKKIEHLLVLKTNLSISRMIRLIQKRMSPKRL